MVNSARIKEKRVWLIGLVVGCGFIAALTACSDNKKQADTTESPKGVSQPSTVQAAPLPNEGRTMPVGDGGICVTLLTDKCTACHSTSRTCEKLGKKSKSRWQRTIDRMIERGAKLSADEAAVLLGCLDNGANNDLQSVCR